MNCYYSENFAIKYNTSNRIVSFSTPIKSTKVEIQSGKMKNFLLVYWKTRIAFGSESSNQSKGVHN